MSTEQYVLDSWAILAWLENEPSGTIVSNLLRRAAHDEITIWMTVINIGEVLYITEREKSLSDAQTALAIIDSLPIKQVEASRRLMLQAAHYKARHRMSYADCFALALAKQLQAPLVTGDPELRDQKEVRVLWIGPNE
ncbi:MAG: type II toxin-antitoxin system VapC family toxin [Actinobacteria bacterium]|nr:type II toxin-antitoxin system VapC family toxin [Actinomycetota bacterium]